MCGLVGMAGAINFTCERAFKDLLIVDSIRGPHSTGVAFVNVSGEVTTVKKVGSPFQLFDSIAYEKEMRYTNCVLMGHNRYATTGKINSTNAHPFTCGDITGAHNGTLTTKRLLDDDIDFDVDSENLFHHMDINGVNKTTDKLGGAYALTWYNEEDESLNFIRNEERTLYYVYSLDFKTIFWASEEWMLYSILDKHGIKHGEAKIFEPFKHYSFITPLDYAGKARVLPAFSIVDVPKYVAPKPQTNVVPYQSKYKASTQESLLTTNAALAKKYRRHIGDTVTFYTSGATTKGNTSYLVGYVINDQTIKVRVYAERGGDLWNMLLAGETDFTGKVKSISCLEGGYCLIDLRSIEEEENSFKASVVHHSSYEEPEYEGYNGRMMTANEWRLATSVGCGWCDEVPVESEQEELVWLSSREHLCAHCAKLDDVKQLYTV